MASVPIYQNGSLVEPENENKLNKSNLVVTWSTTTSDERVASEKLTKATLDSKQDTSTLDTAVGAAGYTKTKVTLNGSLSAEPSIYAPTTVGQNGQFFGSNGTSTGWVSISASQKFAGKKATVAEIEALTGMLVGDSWFCEADKHNYVWNGTEWVDVGMNVDLSGYQEKAIGSAGKALQSDTSGNISASSYTLGAACAKGVATEIASGNTDLPTSGTVYDYATTYLAMKSALTDGSVTKVGTASVGSGVKPIYLNAGTPTVSGSTVGSATQPVYLSGGTITAGTSVIANKLTGYAIASTTSAIATTDTILQAFAKLEKRIKTLEDANLVRYG